MMKGIQSALRLNELLGAALIIILPPDFISASISDTPSGQTEPSRPCPYTTDYCTPEDEVATPIQDVHEQPVYRLGDSDDCKDVYPVSRYKRQ
jgi:hypothetical protein